MILEVQQLFPHGHYVLEVFIHPSAYAFIQKYSLTILYMPGTVLGLLRTKILIHLTAFLLGLCIPFPNALKFFAPFQISLKGGDFFILNVKGTAYICFSCPRFCNKNDWSFNDKMFQQSEGLLFNQPPLNTFSPFPWLKKKKVVPYPGGLAKPASSKRQDSNPQEAREK